MSELLPSLQARDLREGLVDYLTTTFALVDPEPRRALREFLDDESDGIFKGPYLRLRLPFRPADAGWQSSLDWLPKFMPYRHQAQAYERLTTKGRFDQGIRPEPTLVTTGTGSGKTESFLHPILDHVLRAKRAGVTGTKALILYPMNALADDQAGRLTELLRTDPALAGVTAGIYTGGQTREDTRVSPRGLITSRYAMRDQAPDILLTNYKMLDQLLLRPDDQSIWAQSALSLTYLVLDEFHTYDGAQGTDVAMLLRRLGIALKSHWPDEHPEIGPADRARPLGKMTPVATSATLGDDTDASAMLAFAHTVFGEEIAADAVITETRQSWAQWSQGAQAPAPSRLREMSAEQLSQVAAAASDHAGDPAALTGAVLACLHTEPIESFEPLDLIKKHPDIQGLIEVTKRAATYDDALTALFARPAPAAEGPLRVGALEALLAALSHIRATSGRDALGIELNLWIRELTRIDRVAAGVPAYHWSDDGAWVGSEGERSDASFPAIYCRHCGRSGWGIQLAAVGDDLAAQDTRIRGNHMAKEGRFRALLHAPGEGARNTDSPREDTVAGLRWLSVKRSTLLANPPAEDDPDLLAGLLLPVLTHTGQDADHDSKADTCPSCQQADGVRFLGSAVATLLSVTLSVMFGNPALDPREKKSLVFTDSVQDAAHRAGFVQARSHSMTLRAALRSALSGAASTLDSLVDDVLADAGSDAFKRYRLVPPDMLEQEAFHNFWSHESVRTVEGRHRKLVKQRLLLDTSLEVGLQSAFGRTLEATGSIAVSVDAGGPQRLVSLAKQALHRDETDLLPGVEPSEAQLIQWMRGTLEHIRQRGGIHHEWLDRYITEDGKRHWIWGGRRLGMPAFPSGRSVPAFPRAGAPLAGRKDRDINLDSVRSAQSWYARWSAKTLGVNTAHGAKLAEHLLHTLARQDVLRSFVTESKANVYAISQSDVLIEAIDAQDLAAGQTLLVCDLCRDHVPATPTVVGQLAGGPCLVARCAGQLLATPRDDNFYRRLYGSADMRRVVAREHTSLLEDVDRRAVEDGFKAALPSPDAPNVLVATPTLEMGIDIGDLSSVILASLPESVASYLQRIGRAGRLTGNSLNLAFVRGRGDQLPRLGNPLSVINGEVRPPATYLDAAEILRRQYLAAVIDDVARNSPDVMPARSERALKSSAQDTFLGEVISQGSARGESHLDRFLAGFATLDPAVVEDLRRWALTTDDLDDSLPALVHRASQDWNQVIETLQRRQREVEEVLPGLRAAAESPAATEDDRRDFRTAEATLKLTRGELSTLRTQHWVASLEERGILPNYTLLDDIVTLEARVTWVDPDSGRFESDSRTVRRDSAQALRELAPGATFYTRSLAMKIDGVDLGQDGADIHPWVFCSECGFGEQTETALAQCPRCGSGAIADTSQHLNVVRMSHVHSEVRRDRDLITDGKDERDNKAFTIITAADLDPMTIDRQWKVAGVDFGVAHHRKADLRWLNLGPASHGAINSGRVAGRDVSAPLFRVCAGCGKLDNTAGHNTRNEHRPWCRHRGSNSEDTRSIALSRHLRTQAVVVTLPQSAELGDDFGLPSLAAALLLGLREEIGGEPDHLQVEIVPAPVPEGGPGDVRDVLLIHDMVPGGTGYLADLAQPERVWRLLALAYQTIAQCPCRDEGRLACYRCLLPYSRGFGADRLSRVSAERHLREILALAEDQSVQDVDPELMPWPIEDGPVQQEASESPLELQFRQAFKDAVARVGAIITEQPGPTGNTIKVRGVDHNRAWTLRPQVLMHGSKPDFVLEPEVGNGPSMAIFVDGHAFHAGVGAKNRIADDSVKRAALRDQGVEVFAVTHADLSGPPRDLTWLRQDAVATLMGLPAGVPGSGLTQKVVDTARLGPIEMLLGRMLRPEERGPRRELAESVGLMMFREAHSVLISDEAPLAQVAADVLDGETLGGSKQAALWRHGHVVALVDFAGSVPRTVVMIDDRPEALDTTSHHDDWLEWLALSNVMTAAQLGVEITARSLVIAESGAEAEPDEPRLPAAWDEVAEHMTLAERSLAGQLAALGVPVPIVGAEVLDGQVGDFVWEDARVVVLLEADAELETELAAADWHVLGPTPELISQALQQVGER